MGSSRRSYDQRALGEQARINAARRGLSGRQLQPLGKGAVIRQRREICALDWHEKPLFGIRLNRLNPSPRFLLPFSAAGQVELTICAVHSDRAAFGPLALLCNEQAVVALPSGLRRSIWGWTAKYRAMVDLMPDRPSVLEFQLSPAQRAKSCLGRFEIGFGIGKLWLKPAAP